MVERLLSMRELVAALVLTVEAEMPKAQRRMEQGDDWLFEKVTGQLRLLASLDSLLADVLVVETGNPDFGMGMTLSDWARTAPPVDGGPDA